MISRQKLRGVWGELSVGTGSRMLACLALAVFLLALPQGAWADSQTWDNGTGTTIYNNPNNWDGNNHIPGTNAGETATFTNTGAGAVNISAATNFAVGFAFSNTVAYTITVAAGVNQGLTGVGTSSTGNVALARAGSGTYTLNGTCIFTLADNQTTTVSSVVTNAAGVGVTGGIRVVGGGVGKSGTLILSGNNTYTGGTTLDSGCLYVGQTLVTDTPLGTGTLTINSGNFQAKESTIVSVANPITIGGNFAIGGNSSLTLTGPVNLGAATRTLTENNTSNTTLSGIISNGGLIINNTGGGTVTLSGPNTFDGGLTLTAGTLAAGDNSALGSGSLTINGGALQASGGSRSLTNDITVRGNFAIGGTNDLTMSGTVGLGGGTRTLTVSNTANTNLTGVISNGGLSINNSGGATITLSGNNTYASGTTLTAGTLAVSHNSALGTGGFNINGGTLTNNSGGTLTLSNNVTVGGNFNLDGFPFILSGTVNLGGATRTLNVVSNYNHTLSGIISNGGLSLNNTGSGTFTLSGVNTYASGTTLTAGILAAGDNSALGSGGLTLNGGTLQASGGSRTLTNNITVGGNFGIGGTNDLTLSGTVALGAAIRTLNVSNTANTTLSGIISNGGLSINNSGGAILTLSGASTYALGTTLTAGTLAAGDNSALGAGGLTINGGTLQAATGSTPTLSNNVTVGGNFALGGANDLTLTGTVSLGGAIRTLNVSNTANTTLSGIISNGGLSINNSGGAILTLSGASTYALGTTLTAGTVWVNGSLAGDFTNQAGATLGGTGTIAGTLFNSGTVNPGNSVGTLTVGAYAPTATGNHVEEIASATSYDKLVVTDAAAGAATLNGTLTPTLLGGYIPQVNTRLTNIIQTTGAGGTVVGTFSQVANQSIGSSRTLFWQALYNPTSVDLQVVGNYAPADLSLSRNQQSVANILNALPLVTSGDLFEVLNAINALTTDQALRSAFNELSPQKYAALPTLAFPVTHMQFQYLQNRLARQRWEAELGSDVVSSGGGGFMRGFSFGYNNKMLLAASNMTLSDAGNPLIRRGMEHRWGIYLEPMANWGNLRPTANMVGYRYKNFGFTLGADYWVMDNLLVGVNTGYSKTLTGIGGTGGDINADIIPFNAYTSFFVKGFYVNGTLGYTFSNYDMERNVAFGTINRTAKATTSGNQFQAAGETGYDFKVGNAIVGSTVSLQYATQTTGGFTESNAGALNLRVASQTADSLQTGVGARASYKAKVGNVTVKPQLAVVWQHEFSNNTRGVNARLAQGSTTMNFRTDKIGQDFAVVSFDLPARISKNFVTHVGYTAEVGRSKSSNQGVNLGLKYEF